MTYGPQHRGPCTHPTEGRAIRRPRYGVGVKLRASVAGGSMMSMRRWRMLSQLFLSGRTLYWTQRELRKGRVNVKASVEFFLQRGEFAGESRGRAVSVVAREYAAGRHATTMQQNL